MTIRVFKGEYRWLSNFHLAEVEFEGLLYPSTEHAYQAAKTDVLELREAIRDLPRPSQAQKAGQLIPLASDWHTVRKFEVMEEVLRRKFAHEDLKVKLLATGNLCLIEENTWHDNCWGSCLCDKCGNRGVNHLGRLLMKIREDLRSKT